MPYYVYALSDPRDFAKPKYIGMTTRLGQRWGKHITRPNSDAARLWIAALRKEELVPSIQVLATYDNEAEALQHEGRLISEMPNLLNCPSQIRGYVPPPAIEWTDSADLLSTVERKHIQAVLDRNQGNKQDTARALGIGRQTLYNKLKLYGIYHGGITPVAL